MRRYYGFLLNPDGSAEAHPTESAAVKLIYLEYLSGLSLGRIAESLQQQGYLSPTGGQVWDRSSIDNILKKGYYVGRIVTFEEFAEAQFERQARTNINEDTGKRRTTRYHSGNELSGLLLCGECGAPYRRITRHSGEVVWRCANRVEHGKEICQTASTVTEEAINQFLLEMKIDSGEMRKQGSVIKVHADGRLNVIYHGKVSLNCDCGKHVLCYTVEK